MNRVKVRCWKMQVYNQGENPHYLYITYPEDNSGHDLITCLNCGAIYAVTVAKQVYVGPPLQEKIQGVNCTSCRKLLEGNYSYYPDSYIANGKRFSFNRPHDIPPDSESMVMEFEGIYE